MLRELYLYDETSQHPLMRAMQSRIAHRQNEIAHLEWLMAIMRRRIWDSERNNGMAFGGKGGIAADLPRKALKEARQRRRQLAADQRIDKAAYKAMAKGE
jgi:hypothetical protein